MQVSLCVSCRFCFGSESSEAMGALVTQSIQLENATCRLLLSIITTVLMSRLVGLVLQTTNLGVK